MTDIGGKFALITGAAQGIGRASALAFAHAGARVIARLTKSSAADSTAKGIRVNAICPGTVESPSLHQRWAATADIGAARKAFIARQPIGRIAQPEEVADPAVHLAGATYMTRRIHIIDGGWTA
jgi:2-keto-3-deoxy-L-fuconate dehydrogenase